ncbi:MAG TPA: DUF3426 domain-containing protein [Woeseiaceae bacterium]|nr:DUF3426 domain-containing protein [Woeseiaceae bacterium]
MYTQCPDCHTAFRVTAEILQQAAGRVRCGACGHVFDALDGLSQAPPRDTGQPQDELQDEEARFLRDTLGESDDVTNLRIEDTGVEWRVVEDESGSDVGDDDDASDASAIRWYIEDAPDEPQNDAVIPEGGGPEPIAERRQESLTFETGEHEERYDDDTPLPGVLDDDERDASVTETPRRRSEDFIEPPSPEFDERQVDLALGDPDEWTDLLEELRGEAEESEAAAPAADEPITLQPAPDADEDPTAEHLLMATGEPTPGEDEPAAQEMDRSPSPPEEDDQLELIEDEDDPGTADSRGASEETREEMTINLLIDHDLLRAAEQEEDLRASGSGERGDARAPHVETIVLEGDLVRSSLDVETAPAEAGEEPSPGTPEALKDTDIRSRDGVREEDTARKARRYAAVAAIAVLSLLLVAQLVHAWRETLATWGLFDRTVGAVYRRLGSPITPDWDVNGWQFETTNGSTDASDRVLTITSRITNRSEHVLPYPLLHVSLTDRYEELVGSALLEPARYLEIRSARGMVKPGEEFSATVTISPLPPQATGFKLNVCYARTEGRLGCATGAFKAR